MARRTRDLTIEHAGHVDERVAESADGRIPWSRFEELVAAAIVAADPAGAAAREDEAAKHQFARPTASTEAGMRGFYIRAAFFPVIARLDAVVQLLADVLAAHGDTADNDARRVKAILLLCDPARALDLLKKHQQRESAEAEVDWSALLPAVQLFVHIYFGTPAAPSEGVVRVEDVGPVTERYLRTHLSANARVTVTPVLDIEGQAPVDGYEIPDRHRQAVHLMCPADTFPFAPNTRRGKQIDTPRSTTPVRPKVPASHASATTVR